MSYQIPHGVIPRSVSDGTPKEDIQNIAPAGSERPTISGGDILGVWVSPFRRLAAALS
jgi:hypothetical protein